MLQMADMITILITVDEKSTYNSQDTFSVKTKLMAKSGKSPFVILA